MIKVKYKASSFLKLSVISIFLLAVAACGNKEGLGDLADSMVVKKAPPPKATAQPSTKVIPNKITTKAQANKKDTSTKKKQEVLIKDKTNQPTQRRGFFAWLFGSSSQQVNTNKKAESGKTVTATGDSKVSTTKTGSDSAAGKQQKQVSTTAAKKPTNELQIIESASLNGQHSKQAFGGRTTSFLGWSWNKLKGLVNANSIALESSPYREDSIGVANNLNIAVLRVPNSDDLNKKEDQENKKRKETRLAVEKVIPKDELYSGFDVGAFSSDTSNNIKSKQNSNKITDSSVKNVSDKKINSQDNDKEELYKNYVIALKYEGVFTNYNDITPINKITLKHQSLIDRLLIKNVTSPKVIYIIYRNVNTLTDESSVKNDLNLTNYLNLIRSYIYGKNMDNVFVQEVQAKDLPVNQILLIIKPVSIEQFKDLPKQINMYNAPKMSSKEWITEVNRIEKENEKKQEQLYKKAGGKY